MNISDLLRLADLGLYVMERGIVTADKIAERRERREAMIAEQRNPTDAEWADLSKRLGNLPDLDNVADRARRNQQG